VREEVCRQPCRDRLQHELAFEDHFPRAIIQLFEFYAPPTRFFWNSRALHLVYFDYNGIPQSS
jgi:hypothetical protein